MHFVGSALLESLSLWERWHCEAMTERASPARKSRCAAMGRLFVRAMLSLCLCFTCSGLALSGASRQLSQRESPWHFAKLYLFARGSPTRGQQRRPPPVAEAGSRCWGSGQQDASEALRMLGAATRPWRAQARLRGCTKARLHLFRSICTSAPPLTGWAV